MNGTDSRAWYVVRSKPRREAYAQDQLLRRGVETFYPRILEPGRAPGDENVGPLFPGYLFARVDLLAQYGSVIWTPGVRNLVAFGGAPPPIDDAVVEFLQRRCGPMGVVRVLPEFRDGDRVRIKGGPFEGLVGIVQGSVDPQSRVQILMELLRRQTHVSVPTRLLEHVASA